MQRLLDIENLRTTFDIHVGKVQAVRGVDLHVDEGETVGVVGESGCGKSVSMLSVLHLLPDYAKISADKMIFDGTDLTRLTPKMFRKISGDQIGMIFQDPMTSLNPLFTVGDQLTEPLRIHKGISKKEARDLVLEKLRMVEIPDPESRMKQYPHELSGGMRQRVMIAMMLSRTPELLIADEPTTALDVTIEAQILQILKDLKTQYNTAILMITHNFGLVAEVADRIAVMYAGNIVEHGNVFDVFAAPSHPYTRLLMRALPRKTKHEGRLETIDGNVPRITEKKPGCRFANRCPLAKEICFTENPPVLTVSHDHTFSCHFAEEASKL